MNKKWVELFEKVIGRKPTPEEFIAGRDSGFDFKAIKSIAGVAIDQVASEAPGLGGQEPVEELVNPLQQAWEERFFALMDVRHFQKRSNQHVVRTLKLWKDLLQLFIWMRPIKQHRSSHQ